MATNKIENRMVQMYEKVKDREYFIQRSGFLGLTRWDEIVHTERIENELIVEINSIKAPDKVIINGISYTPELRGSRNNYAK